MGLQAYGILLNFAKNKTTIMYVYLGLQDVFFIMLYGMAGFFALLACLYLLLRRGNAFAFLLWRVETLQELESY